MIMHERVDVFEAIVVIFDRMLPTGYGQLRYFLRNIVAERSKAEILDPPLSFSLFLACARFDKVDLAITVCGYGDDRSIRVSRWSVPLFLAKMAIDVQHM
jgi:hypothetical protein